MSLHTLSGARLRCLILALLAALLASANFAGPASARPKHSRHAASRKAKHRARKRKPARAEGHSVPNVQPPHPTAHGGGHLVTATISSDAAAAAAQAPPAGAGLPTWRNLYDWTAGHGYSGWHGATTEPSKYSFATGLTDADGLWVWPDGKHKYDPGYADWTYAAPGTTRIVSVDVTLTYRPRLLSHHCVAVVLSTASGERTASRFCKPPEPPKGDSSTLTLSVKDPTAADPKSVQLAVGIEIPCDKKNDSACSKFIPATDPAADGLQSSRVDMTLVDDDNPIPIPAGEWADLSDDYVNGQGQYGLTVAATDPGSGIRQVAYQEVGHDQLGSWDAPCDPTHHAPELDDRICPASYSVDTTVDSSGLSEGKHVYRETAVDVAGNSGGSNDWAVYVDRTPPGPTSNFDAAYDPETNSTLVTWDSDIDPPLADGSPGSGVVQYRYRYQRGADSWTDWQTTSDPWFSLDGSHEGENVNVEVQAIDEVGNVGAVSSGSSTAEEPQLTPDNVGDPTGDDGATVDRQPDNLGDGTRDSVPFALKADVTDSSHYTERLCVGAGPCGTYNGLAAARYALYWWPRQNHDYRFFGGLGGDCTNFVSQALKAGGFRFMRAHGYNSPNASSETNRQKFLHGEGSWWEYYQPALFGQGTPPRDYDYAAAFVRADTLFGHLIAYDLGELVGTTSTRYVKAGDMVFYDLHGTDANKMDHSQVVTRVTRHQIYVAQHSTGYNKPLSDVFRSVRNRYGVLNRDWIFRIVRPTHTAANIT